MMIVAVLTLLTICSGLAAAHADVITVNHIAQGERMLPDGGWTSRCDATAEQCVAHPVHSNANSYGLHHHHHPDCQVGGLPDTSGGVVHEVRYGRALLPAYAAVIKTAAPSAADQPPKI